MQLRSFDTKRHQQTHCADNCVKDPHPSQCPREPVANYVGLRFSKFSDDDTLRHSFASSKFQGDVLRDTTVNNLPGIWSHEELEYHLAYDKTNRT